MAAVVEEFVFFGLLRHPNSNEIEEERERERVRNGECSERKKRRRSKRVVSQKTGSQVVLILIFPPVSSDWKKHTTLNMNSRYFLSLYTHCTYALRP